MKATIKRGENEFVENSGFVGCRHVLVYILICVPEYNVFG